MNRLLTDNILDSVKAKASVPLSQKRFSPEAILLMLKDILDTETFPMLITAKGMNNERVETLTSDSEGSINIPERAYLNSLSRVKKVSTGTYLIQCDEELNDYSLNTYNFIGNTIRVRDTNTEFEITYTLRPPQLILEEDAPKVLSFNPTTRVIEVDSDTYEGSMDIIAPSGYARALEVPRISTTTATVFVLGGTVTPVVGDYVCKVEESPIIPVPQEMIGLVTRQLVNTILRELPDDEGLKAGLLIEDRMYNKVLAMLKPRGKNASVVAAKPILNPSSRRRRLF